MGVGALDAPQPLQAPSTVASPSAVVVVGVIAAVLVSLALGVGLGVGLQPRVTTSVVSRSVTPSPAPFVLDGDAMDVAVIGGGVGGLYTACVRGGGSALHPPFSSPARRRPLGRSRADPPPPGGASTT